MRTKSSPSPRHTSLSGRAHGTLALYHNILGARPDGYHKFQSLLQQLSIYDTVTVQVVEGSGGVSARATNSLFPIRYISYVLSEFLAAFSLKVDVLVNVDSSIPVGFGLFEKEAAAAKAIKLTNDCLGEPVSRLELLEFANGVSNELLCASVTGSKYADMLDKHKCMISSMPPIPKCAVIIMHPHTEPVNYEQAIEACDKYYNGYRERRNENTRLKSLLGSVQNGSLSEIKENCSNVFSAPVRSMRPDSQKALFELLNHNALTADTVAHSSAVYGIFEDVDTAQALVNSNVLNGYKVYYTEPK